MDRDDRQRTGRRAEDRVEDSLRAAGARVLARNRRYRCGELDLVAEEARADGSCELVFIEVRARTGGWRHAAADSVRWGKRRRVERAARAFLAAYRGPATGLRFDLWVVERGRLQHFRDAWRPGE